MLSCVDSLCESTRNCTGFDIRCMLDYDIRYFLEFSFVVKQQILQQKLQYRGHAHVTSFFRMQFFIER